MLNKFLELKHDKEPRKSSKNQVSSTFSSHTVVTHFALPRVPLPLAVHNNVE